MKPMMHIFLVFMLTIPVGTLMAAPSNEEHKSIEKEKAVKTLQKAETTLDDVMENSLYGIPVSLINKSGGIVIFPEASRIAAGAFNGPGGRGIAMIRNEDDSWSNPFFVTLREGRQGFKLGPETSDIVLLFKERDDIISINKAEIVLGDDVEVESGPLNNGSTSGNDSTFGTEIYSYNRSNELYSGISVQGAIVTYDRLSGNSLYGIDILTMDEIFHEIETPYSDEVNDLIAALSR